MDLEEIDIIAGNWVDSAQDRDYWRALMNVALNLQFHKPWSQLVYTVLFYFKYINKYIELYLQFSIMHSYYTC